MGTAPYKDLPMSYSHLTTNDAGDLMTETCTLANPRIVGGVLLFQSSPIWNNLDCNDCVLRVDQCTVPDPDESKCRERSAAVKLLIKCCKVKFVTEHWQEGGGGVLKYCSVTGLCDSVAACVHVIQSHPHQVRLRITVSGQFGYQVTLMPPKQAPTPPPNPPPTPPPTPKPPPAPTPPPNAPVQSYFVSLRHQAR